MPQPTLSSVIHVDTNIHRTERSPGISCQFCPSDLKIKMQQSSNIRWSVDTNQILSRLLVWTDSSVGLLTRQQQLDTPLTVMSSLMGPAAHTVDICAAFKRQRTLYVGRIFTQIGDPNKIFPYLKFVLFLPYILSLMSHCLFLVSWAQWPLSFGNFTSSQHVFWHDLPTVTCVSAIAMLQTNTPGEDPHTVSHSNLWTWLILCKLDFLPESPSFFCCFLCMHCYFQATRINYKVDRAWRNKAKWGESEVQV